MTLILWLACLALASLLPLILPLLRRSRPVPERGQFDRVVYRDQLRELDRDFARGVLTEAEAASARLEIQRRLLAADTIPMRKVTESTGSSPVLASIVAIFAAGGAAAVYAVMGAPGIPDSPFASHAAIAAEATAPAATEPPGHNDLSGALGKLAAKLKANPSDADGWELYARTAGSMRNWNAAVDGYRHALALGHNGAELQAGYGETLVLQADGIVTPAAHEAFAAALKADPKEDVAQYYMALAAGQAGQPQQAIDLFQGLLADIPEDSPMRDEIGKRIAEAAKAAGVPVPVLAKGTPPEAQDADADATAAAADMPDGEQKKMIEAMVAKLATRLETEPGDVDGWIRLGRAYVVMGDRDKAADAYGRAVAQKPGDVAIRLQAVEGLLSGLKPDDALPPAAVALLRQVEAIAPDESAVLWYLGVNAARDAHPADAKRYWTRLLAKLPAEGEDTRMVKAAMDSLKGG
jgi:cytochrome c-type biogenesis protein CcmH